MGNFLAGRIWAGLFQWILIPESCDLRTLFITGEMERSRQGGSQEEEYICEILYGEITHPVDSRLIFWANIRGSGEPIVDST